MSNVSCYTVYDKFKSFSCMNSKCNCTPYLPLKEGNNETVPDLRNRLNRDLRIEVYIQFLCPRIE